MNINFNKFPDKPALSQGLSFHDQARGFTFGIAAGWVVPQVLDQMISNRLITDGAEVYQVACLACGSAMRRVFTSEEVSKANVETGEFERICFEGFDSEAPCAHFDQFMAFRDTLASQSQYAIDLEAQIIIHARLMEAGGIETA